MASHPLTSSERRGIVIIAALALLVTVAGLCVSYCGRPSAVDEPPKVEVVYKPDSVAYACADSVAKAEAKARRDSLRKERRDSMRRQRKAAEKSYQRRNPIDEELPSFEEMHINRHR